MIECFADDMPPYAAGLAQQLAQQFWRITRAADEAAGDGDDADDDDGVCVWGGCLCGCVGRAWGGGGAWEA